MAKSQAKLKLVENNEPEVAVAKEAEASKYILRFDPHTVTAAQIAAAINAIGWFTDQKSYDNFPTYVKQFWFKVL